MVAYFPKFDTWVHKNRLHNNETFKVIQESNDQITEILEAIDDNTTVIISSDHAIKDDGHGPYSRDYREGILFVYSKAGLFVQQDLKIMNKDREIRTVDVSNIISYYFGNTPPSNSFGNIPLEVLENKPIDQQLINAIRFYLSQFKQKEELISGIPSLKKTLHTNSDFSSLKSRIQNLKIKKIINESRENKMKIIESLQKYSELVYQGFKESQPNFIGSRATIIFYTVLTWAIIIGLNLSRLIENPKNNRQRFTTTSHLMVAGLAFLLTAYLSLTETSIATLLFFGFTVLELLLVLRDILITDISIFTPFINIYLIFLRIKNLTDHIYPLFFIDASIFFCIQILLNNNEMIKSFCIHILIIGLVISIFLNQLFYVLMHTIKGTKNLSQKCKIFFYFILTSRLAFNKINIYGHRSPILGFPP